MTRSAFAALAAYFVLHVALRVFLSGSVELDEAEQIIAAQQLRLIYGSQPPLYSWLQAVCFKLFGYDVLVLSILKHAILALTYVFVYLTAATITGDRRSAVFAMLSLLLIPQISVESHRTLSHSVLATTAAAGATLAFVRLLDAPAASRYVVLGLALGVGALSKYNFLVFAFALVASGLCVPRFRATMLDRRMMLALLAMCVVTLPHVYGVVSSPELATEGTTELGIARLTTHLDGLLYGGADIVLSLTWVYAALGLVYLGVFARSRARTVPDPLVRDYARLVAFTLLIAVGLVLVAVVAFKIPAVKDRWFQPLLSLLPVYVVARLRERIDGRRLAWLAVCAGLAATLSMSWLAVRGTRPDVIGRYVRLHLPMSEVADAARARGFEGGVIASSKREYAGALRLRFDDSIAITFQPGLALVDAPANLPWLVVWEGDHGDRAPERLSRLVRERRGVQIDELDSIHFEALYKHSTEDSIGFYFVIVEP